MKQDIINALRWLLPRLPLPMLALAASYGVYRFALLFVPAWVAVTQAAAFELTYIGLATLQVPDASQRRRATAISIGAVVVSILYNTMASLFDRNPALLQDAPLWAEAALALLHGAPLAVVAYLVADLLLHSNLQAQVAPQVAAKPQEVAATPNLQATQPAAPTLLQALQEEAVAHPALQPALQPAATEAAKPQAAQPAMQDDLQLTAEELQAVRLRDNEGLSWEAIGEEMGFSRTTARARYDSAQEKLAQVPALASANGHH